jgi:Mce-associated membrane protein
VNVKASAVESIANDDSGVVLVAAESKVTNAAGAQQDPRAWRLSVSLQRDGGQLKMSKVEFVP